MLRIFPFGLWFSSQTIFGRRGWGYACALKSVCVCVTKFSKGARSKDGMEWSPALTFAASVTECAVPPPLLLALPLLLKAMARMWHSSHRARSPLTQTLYIRLVYNASCLRRGTGGGGGGKGQRARGTRGGTERAVPAELGLTPHWMILPPEWFSMKPGNIDSHFNVFLTVKDTVLWNHNFWRERRAEAGIHAIIPKPVS